MAVSPITGRLSTAAPVVVGLVASDVTATEPRLSDALPGAAPRQMSPLRRKITLVVRPLVSVVLLGVLFWKFGGAEVWGTLTHASLSWLAVSVVLVVLALVVSAWKWQVLLHAHGLHASGRFLFVSYLVGLFFNNFLPSNIGGDVARVHDVAKLTGQRAAAAASVIGERLLAGLALALTAAVALLFSIGTAQQVGGTIAFVLVLFLAAIGGVGSRRVREWLGARIPKLRGGRLARVAGHLGEALGDRRALVSVLALSFVFQALVVMLGWATFAAIGVPVPLAMCFLFIPVISAIQLVPVSLNGFGVREGAYVVFFGSVGVRQPEAIAASLLFALVIALVSLAGGAIFAVRR